MDNLNEQAYKVSLLFLKTAKLAKSFFWRRQVEKLALRLIEKAVMGNLFEINKILLILELLTKLGQDIQYISGEIFKDLNREISNLKLFINQSEEGDQGVIMEEDGGGDDLIKEDYSQENNDLSKMQSLDEIIKDFRSRTLIAGVVDKSVDKSETDSHNLVDLIGNQSAINRQSAMLEKIRQFGNCRMKDFMTDFPDISERTLRNDLQRLCEKGLIRKVGNGGAYTFYTTKM